MEPSPSPRAFPKTEFTKTVGATEVKPIAVSQSAPKTTFDLDLHAVKATDTYANICREYYNDAKYEIALKEFNRGRTLSSGGMLEIPPIHVLKKQFPGSIAAPARTTPGVAPEWGAATTPPAAVPTGTRPTEFRASSSGTYTVPTGGAKISQIARLTLGSDQRWKDIWDMNPQYKPDEVLPAGTVLKLPSDARVRE